MSDLDDRRLDAAIRDLLGRAVADAPPAPTIDEHTVRPDARSNVLHFDDTPHPDRRGWIVTAIAGASIAAAVVGLIVMGGRDDAADAPAAPTPATLPVTLPTVPRDITPSTLAPGQTTVAAPATAPVTTPSTVPATAPPETVPPTTAEAVRPAGDRTVMTSAGANGITEQVAVDPPAVRYSGAAAVVANAGDGRIYFQPQRRWDAFADSVDTRLLVLAEGSTDPVEVALPGPLQGRVLLHDAAIVAGEAVVILERQPDGPCANPDGCTGGIWALWPDSGQTTELDARSVWEFGWSRLTLATNGVIVGETSSGPVTAPYSLVVPGSGATPVDFAGFGLEPSYSDCAPTCPTRFAIDPTGRYVGWIDWPEGGSPSITVAAIDGSGLVRRELDGELSWVGDLDLQIQELSPSGSLTGRAALSGVESGHWSGAGPQPAVLVDLATGTIAATDALMIEFGG